MREIVIDTDLEPLRLQFRGVQVEKIEPVVRLLQRQVTGMTVIKRRERQPRVDEIEIGQAFARRLLLRRAARDRIDLSGVEGFDPVGPFRAINFDRPVAEAEMRDGDRLVDCRPVTVVITARIHLAALQAQDRRGILIDRNRRRRRRRQQSVMMFRQYLAQAARHFRYLGTRNSRRRKELSCEPGWQV